MKNKQLPSKPYVGPSPRGKAAASRAEYTDEFKRMAVLRLRQREQSATDLALELGIRRNQLYKWAKKFDEQAPEEIFRSPGRPILAAFNHFQHICQLRIQCG
jgi:transposase